MDWGGHPGRSTNEKMAYGSALDTQLLPYPTIIIFEHAIYCVIHIQLLSKNTKIAVTNVLLNKMFNLYKGGNLGL